MDLSSNRQPFSIRTYASTFIHAWIKSPLLSSDPIHVLRQEFRGHLEQFYAHLNLAPPYHSIEKAVQHLSNTLRTKSEEFREGLLQDAPQKWALFEEIFSASGLPKKHRGIIQHLALSSSYSVSSTESLRFLRNFADAPPKTTSELPARSTQNEQTQTHRESSKKILWEKNTFVAFLQHHKPGKQPGKLFFA